MGERSELSEHDRADLMSRREQDEAFVAALRREVLAGRERVTACPAPAASTIPGDAQMLRAAAAARAGGQH